MGRGEPVCSPTCVFARIIIMYEYSRPGDRLKTHAGGPGMLSREDIVEL